jgi:hypothetical protein
VENSTPPERGSLKQALKQAFKQDIMQADEYKRILRFLIVYRTKRREKS